MKIYKVLSLIIITVMIIIDSSCKKPPEIINYDLLPADSLKVLGDTAINKGDYFTSAIIYEVLVRKEPQNGEAYKKLGDSYYELDQKTQAIETYEKAISILGSDTRTFFRLGNLYYEKGDYYKAREYFGKVENVYEDDKEFLSRYAKTLIYGEDNQKFTEGSDIDAAIKVNKKLERIDPGNVEAIVAQAYLMMHLPDVDLRDVKEILKRAEKKAPERVDILISLGELYFKEENVLLAQKKFERVLQSEPDNYDALIYLARIHNAKKEFDIADDYFRKAIEVNPKSFEARKEFAKFLEDQGNNSESLSQYEEALKLKPKDKDLWDYVAQFYSEEAQANLDMGEYATAYELFKKAAFAYKSEADLMKKEISEDINNPQKWSDLGDLLFYQVDIEIKVIQIAKSAGNESEAQEFINKALNTYANMDTAYSKALELTPSNSKIADNLGLVYKNIASFHYSFTNDNDKINEYLTKAENSYLKAIELDPDNTDAMIHLADFYEMKAGYLDGIGDKKGANEYRRKSEKVWDKLWRTHPELFE